MPPNCSNAQQDKRDKAFCTILPMAEAQLATGNPLQRLTGNEDGAEREETLKEYR